MEQDTLELAGLDKLLKALKSSRPPVCKIGIIGKTGRTDGKSNATIGAVHEFGSPARNIPARSFLRMPLADNLNKKLEAAGLTSEEHLKKVIKQGSMKPWMDTVAVIAEAIVLEAFQTGGFGKWAPWKDPNYTNEGGMLLVDSGQLRDSISSIVEEG